MLKELQTQAENAAIALIEAAGVCAGQTVVVGCSTSEVLGKKIGTFSSPEAAQAVFDGLYSVFNSRGIFLAAQCCEHLNRAIIIEKEGAESLERVNAVPVPKAGGSFAAAAYNTFKKPVAVEEIAADAGLDIGNTFIGMHLKRVAIPVRLEIKKIGEANLTAARTRPKYIGGERAVYDKNLF